MCNARQTPERGLHCPATGKPIITTNELGMFCEDRCDEAEALRVKGAWDRIITPVLREVAPVPGQDDGWEGTERQQRFNQAVLDFVGELTEERPQLPQVPGARPPVSPPPGEDSEDPRKDPASMANGQHWHTLPHRTRLKYIAAAGATLYDPKCSCGWFAARGRHEDAEQRRQQHLRDVRAIRRVAAHAGGELTVPLLDELILAVLEATIHTDADRWLRDVSITVRTSFVPVQPLAVHQRLAALAGAGRLDRQPVASQRGRGRWEYRLPTSPAQASPQQGGTVHTGDVRAAVLLVFQVAHRDDPERWLVTRMVRNRTGLDVGQVRDLGAHVAALADLGMLERRPTGRMVRDRPIFEYRLASPPATDQDGPTTTASANTQQPPVAPACPAS